MKLLLLLRKKMLLFIDLEPQNDKVWSWTLYKSFRSYSQLSRSFNFALF